MKWIKNDVLFERGNYEPIIAKFDNSKVWLVVTACCTQQTARSLFKELGEKYGAKSVEIKKMYSVDDQITEENIVGFLRLYDGTYLFRNELNVPEGQNRQFIKFSETEIFQIETY